MSVTFIHDEALSEKEARERLIQDGPNELPIPSQRGIVRLLRDIVSEPMFLLLVACGAIYMFLGDLNEALMLLGFVFVVIGITFFQQRRTERSLAALRDFSSPRALVARDGLTRRIDARELVRGDIVLLAEGERVPADIYILNSSNLAVDESMLTGESVPVPKESTPISSHAVSTSEIRNAAQLFSGTLVTQGTACGRVIATAERSALGRIGQSLASIKEQSTPIQIETRRIVKRVATVGLALAGGLAIAYWLTRGDWLNGLLAGLTLAMAILPEELPVVLSLFLGLGAWRIAREKVLARSIPAIELLGATTVLCVDKTGTLTTNRMALRRLWIDSAIYDTVIAGSAKVPEELHSILEFAVLASHRRAFDPMESAIGDAGTRLLADTEHLHGDWTLIEDYPLSREMLAMSRVWQSPDQHERVIAAKGAPEAIVDLCHLDTTQCAQVARQVQLMAADGLRVLGIARAIFAADALPSNQHDFDFEFLGLLALEDPLRPDVPQAIATCHAAGIRVVMITGDHSATAVSIARQAGIPTEGAVITGAELATLNDDELRIRLTNTHIFSRIRPEQKLRLVQAFRARGDVVAMTGDGVNDAPALKAANIGVAMGTRGTDVAREAAALVLLNDDFSSLVVAVRYGRRVFANLRKAIVFVVAVHVPIVGLSIMPVVLGWPMLLLPVHILFLQLIIDPACSIVFEAEPLEVDAMLAQPRGPEAHLFDAQILVRGLWQGGGLLVTLLAVYAGTRFMASSDDMARAMTFTVLVISNLGLIHANRSWGQTIWRRANSADRYFGWTVLMTLALLVGALGIPAISRLFAFVLPTPSMLLAGVCIAALNFIWFEAVKYPFSRRGSLAR